MSQSVRCFSATPSAWNDELEHNQRNHCGAPARSEGEDFALDRAKLVDLEPSRVRDPSRVGVRGAACRSRPDVSTSPTLPTANSTDDAGDRDLAEFAQLPG